MIPKHSEAARGMARARAALACLQALCLATLAAALAYGWALTGEVAGWGEANRVWAQRIDQINELARLTDAANAPGNDIFNSRDVERERARLDIAKDTFAGYFRTVRVIAAIGLSPAEIAPLNVAFDQVGAAMEAMTREAEGVLQSVERGRMAVASSQMAAMDRRHRQTLEALERARAIAVRFQDAELGEQERGVARARLVLGVLGAIAGALILAIAALWLWMRWKSVKDDAASKLGSSLLGPIPL